MKKKLYFGSNLKMYKPIKETVEYLQSLVEHTKDISRDEIELFIIPSYTTLESAVNKVDRDFVKIGAQNMCWEDEGQFTGEISPVMLKELGPDTGYDSISEDNSIKNASRLFDKLNSENCLPMTIVFNLNPKMNAEIMTLIGCFQSDEARGKMQYGPAWWFLDNKVGMYKHLDDLTATGHLGAFVGMLTDSRSFLSYPRHRYFRRILCSYLGKLMESGEITANEALVGELIKDVSYRNATRYFGIKD